MYGSETSDWVVKYYDLAFGISGEHELAWYLDKVEASGGPVLDLACGTGRLALKIAEMGYEVVGVDHSEGMLKHFQDALGKEPVRVQKRISLVKQPMARFNLNQKFKSVICSDAFFHNLTVADEISCLQHIADHLMPKGRLFFNLPNPNCDFILKSEESTGDEFELRGKYNLKDGSGVLVVEQSNHGDAQNQTVTTHLRFTLLDEKGKEIDRKMSSWRSRYLFPYEVVHLLVRCGFRVKALVGDYQNGPVEKGSQLIFDAELNVV